MSPWKRWFIAIKLLSVSGVGIFLFFIPLEISGRSTILLDHISEFIIFSLRPVALTFLVCIMLFGGLSPFLHGRVYLRQRVLISHIRFRKGGTTSAGMIFSSCQFAGLALSLLYLSGYAPQWMMQPNLLPFLFEKLALTVGILIPLGSMALTFLLGFGLLEMVGVLMEKVMRPLFRTPGYSAVDAVTSFAGSYSLGLLITSRMYWSGRYSLREAVIAASGFSTVSATFMVVVAKTLGLMDHWNFCFWATFVITFLVTTITAYLPPISAMDNLRSRQETEQVAGSRLRYALATGIRHYLNRPPLGRLLHENLKQGLAMSAVVAPSVLAIGFIGSCVASYTPLFEWLGYLLKPVLMLTGVILSMDNAPAVSGAVASGLAEMFLPAILLKDHPDVAIRFIAAVTSVSGVLFFSGCIPCILATRIPVKMINLMIIWLLRTVLSILLSGIAAWMGLNMGWL